MLDSVGHIACLPDEDGAKKGERARKAAAAAQTGETFDITEEAEEEEKEEEANARFALRLFGKRVMLQWVPILKVTQKVLAQKPRGTTTLCN